MKIVVLVKEVPDTYGDRTLVLETGLADRAAGDVVLDEVDERALEVALTYADAHPGTEVIALTMAPERATTTVRKALAMGATSALHVVDEALLGADMSLTAEVLAAAIRRAGFDLVIAGNLSTDGSGGAIPSMVAEWLQVPQLTSLTAVGFDDTSVTGTRLSDGGTMTVTASLPAVVSITDALPEARFPNFKGIMAAKKKPYDTVSLADLGVDADDPDAARSIVLALDERPPRSGGVKVSDDGDGGRKLADFLAANGLV